MHINLKRVILISLFALGLIIVISSNVQRAQSMNLLIISVDTLRADHMGVYGYPKNTTPNIDKWAKKATVFTNARTVVPMTYPSFTALMTGKDPFHTRIVTNYDIALDSNSVTLAKILKENGYYTYAFLPWSDTLVSSAGWNSQQGFDGVQTAVYKFFYPESKEETYGQLDRQNYDNLIGSVGNWLGMNKQKKFFLWVHLIDPHVPYFPPQDLRCKLNKKYCSEIEGKNLEDLEKKRVEFQKCQNRQVPNETLGLMETLYDGEVANADRSIGKILESLKKTGLDNKTLVVFYGDHGEGFDHNYYFNHGEVLYDSAIKIPLIIKSPFMLIKGKDDNLIQNTDVLPSILDILGIKYSKGDFNGSSFVGQSTIRKYAYSVNSTWTKFSISDKNYKYIYSLPESCLMKNKTEELYDISADPEELYNIVDSKRNVSDNLKKVLLYKLSEFNLPQNKMNIGIKKEQQKALQDLKSLGY